MRPRTSWGASLTLTLTALSSLASLARAGTSSCEKLDGDCPTCAHPWLSGLNTVAEVHLSNESLLVASATKVDAALKALDPANIQRFDSPATGLHTSLFYFCCHSLADQVRMNGALHAMRWESFDVTYNSFGCNLDHDNKTVYLHALPANQTLLFNWARGVEEALASVNVTCNHPRRSKFHMTLARVSREYPVDKAVATFNTTVFGKHRLCSFKFDLETFYATDACGRAAAAADERARVARVARVAHTGVATTVRTADSPPPPLPAASRFEAENGTLSGATTAVGRLIKGFSGTGYVTGFKAADCAVAIGFSVPRAGLYEVVIGYHAGSGDKGFGFQVNGSPALDGTFKGTAAAAWGRVSAGKFMLPAGASVGTVLDGWGYFEVDYIDVAPAAVAPPRRPPKTLADPAATGAAKKLMSFLVDTFGTKVLAGTQVRGPSLDAVAYAANASGGKQPALVEGGLLKYSPSFAERAGNVTNGYIEAVGEWATVTTKQRGVLALCWHWNSPCDLMDTAAHPDPEHPWFQAFYTKNTHFNLSFALANPASPQHAGLLRDLDALAAQLAKLSALGLPVLWRPLHEAAGGWFWWGASGPAAFRALWTLMFERFTQTHGLHNLLWVYTADPSKHDWYPGDNMVDVVGADVYEASGSTMDGTWEKFKAQFEGKKLITLSETGAMPVPDAVRSYKTLWSWFNTWDITKYNISAKDVYDVYNDADVLTLDELPDWRA